MFATSPVTEDSEKIVNYSGKIMINAKLDVVIDALLHKPITHLNLSNCALRDVEAERLATAIQNCPTLENLNVSGNHISKIGADQLLTIFNNSTTWSELDLCNNLPTLLDECKMAAEASQNAEIEKKLYAIGEAKKQVATIIKNVLDDIDKNSASPNKMRFFQVTKVTPVSHFFGVEEPSFVELPFVPDSPDSPYLLIESEPLVEDETPSPFSPGPR